MKTKLLCTFSNKKTLEQHIKFITNNIKIYDKRILILHDVKNENNLYLLYNTSQSNDGLRDTIVVHRHKQTNTIYTINCVNWMVDNKVTLKCENDKVVNWDCYKNSFMVIRENKLTVIELKIKDIIKLKK